MELYSGRLDIIDKPTVINHLKAFYETYGSEEHDFIVCYEEKTKAGLPCKPHVHFLFYSDQSHDKMRKTLSGYGYKGSLGSLSKVSNNPKWSKESTYSYILKQQEPILTNLEDDEINELKEVSKQCNDEIHDKMLTFHQHWEKCIIPSLLTLHTDVSVSRVEIVEYVHKYITKWNKQQDTAKNASAKIKYPNKHTLMPLIVQFEGAHLSEEEALHRYKLDFWSEM